MRVLLSLLLVAAAFAGADACSRRSNRRGNGNNAILITPRNPPIKNPPSPAPTPPPPPPPIPEGWVPAPPRPPAQEMTRTNCKARVEFHILEAEGAAKTTNKVDRSLIQEQWVYTCKFQVYVEVDVAETNQPVNCACGMAHARKRPALDPNYQKAFKTKITYFSMVAFDVVRNVVVDVFPSGTFDNLEKNPNTTAELARAAATNSMDYESVVQGFSGRVKALSKQEFPEALQEGSPKWTPNVVAAMCFTVEEEYISSYKWPQPPKPLLYTTPNVWVSQCYPHFDFPKSQKRDVLNADKQRYWFKDFLLFPVGEGAGVTRGGFTPKSRYITAFYKDSNCSPHAGVVSFDREFDSVIERETTFKIYGAFSWTRTYTSVHVIGGVPTHFSNNLQFWRLGFTKVTWKETYGRESDSRAYRQGVTAHALLGTEASGEQLNIPFIGASAKTKLCDKVPESWKTCPEAGTNGCADLRATTYAEDAFNFRVPDAALDGDRTEIDCSMTERPGLYCRTEGTILSFQNFGSLARDYAKRQDSILLTGPRKEFCTSYPTYAVFDSLYFKPHRGGAVHMVKRGVAQAEKDPLEMINQQTDFTHDGDINAQPNRNVGAQPNKDDVVVQPGTGSADSSGRPGGDHPLTLFPETYTVPVTLDPYDTTFDDGRGTLFDGQEAPCLEGSRGCTCRKAETTGRQRPQCDAPLECNEQEFCEPPLCVAGQPGCPCANSECTDASPFKAVCTSNNVCALREACEKGTNGCSCDDDTPCKDDKAICNADGFCAQAVEETCTAGEGGCVCDEGACNGAGLECNKDNVCARPVCSLGTRGCQCELGQCEAGFTCSSDNTCKQAVCPEGEPGCQCAEGRKCTAKGFACRDFKKDGTDSRCVAEGKNCGDQTARCIRFCGVGNVVRCPPCSNQQPQCAGAAHVVPSVLVALALAVLAALF